jgi:hypothetical protein
MRHENFTERFSFFVKTRNEQAMSNGLKMINNMLNHHSKQQSSPIDSGSLAEYLNEQINREITLNQGTKNILTQQADHALRVIDGFLEQIYALNSSLNDPLVDQATDYYCRMAMHLFRVKDLTPDENTQTEIRDYANSMVLSQINKTKLTLLILRRHVEAHKKNAVFKLGEHQDGLKLMSLFLVGAGLTTTGILNDSPAYLFQGLLKELAPISTNHLMIGTGCILLSFGLVFTLAQLCKGNKSLSRDETRRMIVIAGVSDPELTRTMTRFTAHKIKQVEAHAESTHCAFA